jgi:hypothetical protein
MCRDCSSLDQSRQLWYSLQVYQSISSDFYNYNLRLIDVIILCACTEDINGKPNALKDYALDVKRPRVSTKKVAEEIVNQKTPRMLGYDLLDPF